MRRVSKKTAARTREAAPVREQLVIDLGHCEWCLRVERTAWPPVELQVHEIANAALRQQALDLPYAILALCADCHRTLHRMAKDDAQRAGLAILYCSRGSDYDLVKFNRLVNPNAPKRIEQREIDLWIRRLLRNEQ